jgi:hypothetical protein
MPSDAPNLHDRKALVFPAGGDSRFRRRYGQTPARIPALCRRERETYGPALGTAGAGAAGLVSWVGAALGAGFSS